MKTLRAALAASVVALLTLVSTGLTASPPAAEICGTMKAWLESPSGAAFAARTKALGVCPGAGVCDNPTNRNAAIPTANTPFKLVPLRFQVFASDDGSNPAATPEQIQAQVDTLNADFASSRFYFSHSMRTISNSTYRFVGTAAESTMKATYAELPEIQFNVFVTRYTNFNNCGIATFPWDANALTAQGGMRLQDFSVTPTNYGLAVSFTECISHEMGHMLGLLHTFAGTVETAGCIGCRELPGRNAFDGDRTGDFCSDTQPEFGDTSLVAPCPQGTNTDACNLQPYTGVDTNNFMSYHLACYSRFTPQQMGRMHCWSSNVLGAILRNDSTPPVVEITSPTNLSYLATLTNVSGWATDDFLVQSVGVTIRELGPDLGVRYWNGTNFQATPFILPTVPTGTNWTLAPGVALPPLNSGISYDVIATAVDGQFGAASANSFVFAPVQELTWDLGTTHLGTEIMVAPHALGGPFVFKIITQGTTVGGWRTALTVTSGDADLFLRQGSPPTSTTHDHASILFGSDGFVLHSSQFAESQEWFYLVNANSGAAWQLVSGEPHVLDLGTLPDAAAGGFTNVTMGAEGWRFFRTVPPANTLAWRLWLNGAGNTIYVQKDFIPLDSGRNDLNQPGAMLVVPDYLQDNQTYFVGVRGAPELNFNFQSKQQPITDIAFNSAVSDVVVNGYPYNTYRVPVPIDQIAWQVRTAPTTGNPDLAIRRNKVPNEFNNDAYSEVPGAVQDSVTLVPPTLSDGTFYITVYGATSRTAALTNGEPHIPLRAFALTNVNDQPTVAGWRYYVVSDIPSQLGTLGWELQLTGQVPGTEIALRRNAVPGRWNYRVDGFTYSQGYVDYSETDGWLQRPGHQADIWYIGIYQPNTSLGAFTLDTHAFAPPLVAFDGMVTNITGLPLRKWRYLRSDVPADAMGWDLRITNYSGGEPGFAVRRDLLPDSGGSGLHTFGSDWPSGATVGPDSDWTGYAYNPDGSVSQGKVLVVTRNHPLQTGTYYVGLRADSGAGPVNISFVSRGIGTNYAIGVSNLNFSGPGSSVTLTRPAREPAYFRFVVPPDQPNWKLRLTPTSGEALLVVLRDVLPNTYVGYEHTYNGVKSQKAGRDHFLLLPNDGNVAGLLPGETNFLAVVSEGDSPTGSTIGTGTATFTLESLGPVPVTSLGALTATPGSSVGQPVAAEGGETKLFRFTVAPNTPALEVRLTNRVGNPSFALLPGTNAPAPHVEYPPFGEAYGAEGGLLSGRLSAYSLVTIANPPAGVWTMTVKAEDQGPDYPDATADLSVTVRGATTVAFNNGVVNVTGHPTNEWRYYQITVPANALGWDVRLKNVSGGYPIKYVRRDLLPEPGASGFPVYNTVNPDWPAEGQLLAPSTDWTGRGSDPGPVDYTRKALTVGMGNALSPGTYFIGVYNDVNSGGDTAYMLESRGIGGGFAIGITNLNFSGAGSARTNSPGLAPREADFYQLVIPPNARSWKLRATATDGGELLLLVHGDRVPSSFTHPHARGDGIGHKMQKLGREFYLLLPDEGQGFLVSRTNYLAVISEGHDPVDNSTIGTNAVSYILESLGEAPVTDLGLVPDVGAGIISDHFTLEGGDIRLLRFALSNAVESIEIRLENRVGNPSVAVIPGTNLPYAGVPTLSFDDDFYGIDAGWLTGRGSDYQLINIANPAPGIYSVAIKAEDHNGSYPDVEADFTVTAVGSGNVAFDGGTAGVAGQLPGTWRYFTIEVPADALGWDLRLNDVSGEAALFVRRDELPSGGAPSVNQFNGDWPSGHQFTASSEWTGRNNADGSSVAGHIVAFGRGNPLTNGTYRIGVFNGSATENAGYTLTSRGIGAAYSIPVSPLGFNDTAAHPGLAPREVAYYVVEVPSGAPSWRLKLDTSAGGEALLYVHRDFVPHCYQSADQAHNVGKRLAKDGDEHYVLLPSDGQTNLDGGTYYLAVVSEGLNPPAGRLGAGDSAFTVRSLGPLPVTALGTVPGVGSGISFPVSLEGAEVKAFQYDVPPGVQWLELRLASRQGNPGYAVRRGPELPIPQVPTSFYNPYGADGGWSAGRSEGFDFQTFVRPEAGTWALTVKAEFVGQEYPGATNIIELEQKIPAALVFSNGLVSASLGDNQRVFYQVTVPANVPGWKLDLIASNGLPQVRARKGLLPSDSEPAMPFGGPSIVIAPPFLEPGTWFVEVKGNGPTTFRLNSNPVLFTRPAWDMPAFGMPVTTPGLPSGGPLFADTGVDTNGVPLPLDQGTDLGAGDFHYYAVNVPEGNGGLLRAELVAISGNPDLFVRRGGLPTTAHPEFGAVGGPLVDFQLTGTGTEYANWVPLDGRTESQFGPGPWYLAVRANASNVRYRMKLGVGTINHVPAGDVTFFGQVIAAGDWRYYRLLLPTNAPLSITVTYSQQQGDVEMYVRDTVPPGEPQDPFAGHRRWGRDTKNGGPYPDFPDPGVYTLATPTLRPGHAYYFGFRAVNDASFTVNVNSLAAPINVTNEIAFYGGTSTVTLPAFGVAKFRVPVPADATSWRHSNTHSATVQLYLDQGTLPDLSLISPYAIWQSSGGADSQLIQFLYGWPWVTNQNYYFLATNTSASAQSLTIRMDGRNAVSDDSDGDGLPDGWEILHFGNLAQDGADDTDGDGIDNATELAEGTNPANAASLRPRLTVQTTGSGHVVIEPDLASYTAGQSITLTAVPDPGNLFGGWSGDTTNLASNPLTFGITSNMTITATFSGAAVPLLIEMVELLPGGGLRFVITGPPAAELVVESAGALGESWLPQQTNSPFTGTFTFEDTTPGATNRFYRARLP
jgi:hypothetical protein